MDCSLVICTRNRADRLRRTLARVGAVTTGVRWELVVVENACSDRTAEVIREFRESAPVPVRHVVEPVPGLDRARNTGCKAARGDVVALIDDDCYPDPDYVDALLDVFREHPVDYVGGRVVVHDSSDARFTVREGDEPELLPPHRFPRTGFIIGANMAFRARVFREIGGFDELLGAGTPFVCGDIEFCARASDHGFRGGYFPGPTVRHHHGRKPGPEIEELRAVYDRGRGAYYAKTLLTCSSLRVECLKWWYWDLDVARPGQTRRELCAAFHYLFSRVAARLGGSGASSSGSASGQRSRM